MKRDEGFVVTLEFFVGVTEFEKRSGVVGLQQYDAPEVVDCRFVLFEIVVDPADAIERGGHRGI